MAFTRTRPSAYIYIYNYLVVTHLVGRRYLLDVTVTAIAHSGGVTLKQAFAKRTAEKTTKYQREAKEREICNCIKCNEAN